jgi:hypothetical protein
MSTKSSLYYSSEMHLYKEFTEDNSVFLKIKKINLELKVEFKLIDFLKIASTIDFNSLRLQANLSDAEIKKYCIKRVKERINEQNPIMGIYAYMIFGDKNMSEDEQVQIAFEYYCNKRNELKDTYNELNKSKVFKNFFGLEDIVN